jgi:hypothetical protein
MAVDTMVASMATMNIEAITDAMTSGRDDFDGGDVMFGFVITLRRLPAAGETSGPILTFASLCGGVSCEC